MKYTERRRLEKAVRRAAQQHGFGGDPFAPDPPLGTMRQELAAVELLLQVPLPLRRCDEALAQRMCRAAVMDVANDDDLDTGEATHSHQHNGRHPAIARANAAALARRSNQRGPRR